MKQVAEHGWDVGPAAVGAAGLVLGIVFVRRQRTVTHPMLDVSLFRRPAFSASIGANSVLTLASAALGMLAFQHLQLVLGYRPMVTALWMLPVVAATMVGITLATTAVKLVRFALVIGTGLATAAVGFWLFTQLDADDTLAAVLLNYGILNLGMGMVISLAHDLVITTAPREQAGTATGINETGSELGGALGIAVLGTIAGATYRERVLDTLPDLPSESLDAASGSLGGATALAETLPSELAVVVLESAQEAFTAGINVTAHVATVLLVATATVVTIALRRVRLDSPGDG